MLTIGLYPNTKKHSVNTVLGWMIQYLRERQVTVLLPSNDAQTMGYPELACDPHAILGKMDLALTLGGDGTLLSTAREIAASGVPVCGVNLGRLGFLTEIELPELSSSLEKIIQGHFTLEERLMLEASVEREDEVHQLPPALNDVVVTKGGFSRMIRIHLYIDGELTASYPADGLVIATSTGSTGYSLSAGGPIVAPNVKVLVLTPICPHSLQTRSLVVSENQEVKLRMEATHDDIVLTVDGQTTFHLKPDDKVTVKRSLLRAKFIRLEGNSYYQSLRTKLRRGDHERAE